MSKSESKKKSPPSKPSKKQEEPAAEEVDASEVHTANNWESADLGDNQRKQKFLRLMGAKKRKDESGPDRQTSHDSNPDEDVSPEKKHCRSKAENETINRDLEQQFNESLQSKINHTHHGGLGFHGGNSGGASSSADWRHQSTKTAFVPAKTEAGAAMDHVTVESTEAEKEKSSESSEKKKKKKRSKS